MRAADHVAQRTTAAAWPTGEAAVPAWAAADESAEPFMFIDVAIVADAWAIWVPAGPPWPTLTMMSANSLRLDQPAEGVDRELELLPPRDRLLADLPGRHLHVLLADGVDHVVAPSAPATPSCPGRARPAWL